MWRDGDLGLGHYPTRHHGAVMDSQFDPEREPQACCPPGYVCKRCEPDLTGDARELMQLAINVIDMYDQANTGDAITRLGGSRIGLLDGAIEELRRKLNEGRMRTILP